MTHAHRLPLAAPRAGRLIGLVVAALCAVATLSLPAAAADDPSPAPGSADVLLAGPTGSLGGVPVPERAPLEVATLPVFDTYGRDPALAIAATAGSDDAWMSWEVTAVPAAAPDDLPVTLVAGVAEVPIPVIEVPAPEPGDWLVRAALVARDAPATGTWAWRLVIPDRSLPEAFSPPEAILSAGGEVVVGERGNTCYLGSCGDVGGYPPDRKLPRLHAARSDEPIALALSDASSLANVHVLVTPLDPLDEGASAVIWDGPPFDADDLLLVPSPGPGTWRLELAVRFDHGRGDAVYLVVVNVP